MTMTAPQNPAWDSEEDRPMVSVGMTVYNQERYVARAIESILMQRVNFAYEIVIAEDCSTDSSREIVMDYAARYPEVIRLILQEHNVGLRAQSLCLKKACRGIYRAQLEGDDYWLTDDRLQLQVDFLESHPDFIAVSGQIRCVNRRGHLCAFPYGNLTSIYLFNGEYTIAHFQKWLLPSHTSALLYRNVFYRCAPAFLDAYEAVDVMGDRKTALLLVTQGRIWVLPKIISMRRIDLSSEANFTGNSVKEKPYYTIFSWMERLEKMSANLFGVKIDMRGEQYRQWGWALKNFGRTPNRANLTGLIRMFFASRQKVRYFRDVCSILKDKIKKKRKEIGFWRTVRDVIKWPFKAVKKLLGPQEKGRSRRAEQIFSMGAVAGQNQPAPATPPDKSKGTR